MRSDEFLKNVTEVGGPSDAESAAVVTRTVLDNLGKQLKGGEAADLAAQLPAELQEPLQRHGSEAPLTDDVDDFLRRLAEQLVRGSPPTPREPMRAQCCRQWTPRCPKARSAISAHSCPPVSPRCSRTEF